MTIAVAYRPDEFGRAALDWAAAEARTKGDSLLIINVHRVEPRLDTGHAKGRHVQAITEALAVDNVPFEVRQVEGRASPARCCSKPSRVVPHSS